MVEDSIPTFEMFCRYQEMAIIAGEQQFADLYRDVVRSYAGFADPDVSAKSSTLSPQITMRWRNVGLRAIRAVVGPDGLFKEGRDLLNIILPVILKNLHARNEDMLAVLQFHLEESEKKDLNKADNRRSVGTDMAQGEEEGHPIVASRTTDDADRRADIDARLLALGCLERIIVSASNRGQIQTATHIVLQFIASKGPLPKTDNNSKASGNWATSLIELIAKWCPVQIRFVILVSAMEELLASGVTDVKRSCTFASIVEWLLKSPLNMIGLSVMDVLLGLLRLIAGLLQPISNGTKDNNPHAEAQLLSLLELSVGNLATHIYYSGQIGDIIRTILIRTHDPASEQQHHLPQTSTSDKSDANSKSSDGPIRFTSSPAKVAALRAVKNVLHVASLKNSVASGGGDSRKPVGIYVWEGTQWLLSDSDRNVRYAYADAFLTWLKLETSKNDLLIKDTGGERQQQLSLLLSPRYSTSELSEAATERRAATVGSPSQKEKAQTNFLRMFHVTIYEIALEEATAKDDSLLLIHLLMTSLVEYLGVNALRFGLPMILQLQDDSNSSATAQINIGSLVYGYLWAVSRAFELENTSVGSSIVSEIEKRKKLGVWLESVTIPPIALDEIARGTPRRASSDNVNALTSFRSREEFVREVESSYKTSRSAVSGPSLISPEKGRSVFVTTNIPTTTTLQKESGFPTTVKEQLLSNWSKEWSLAAAESDSARAASRNGSRNETSTLRNGRRQEENGIMEESSKSVKSQISMRRSIPSMYTAARAPPSRQTDTGSQAQQTQTQSTTGSTRRGSVVRMSELKQILSTGRENQTGMTLDPLRGPLALGQDQANNRSRTSSTSSDSLVSAEYTPSEQDEEGKENGEETPKASVSNILPQQKKTTTTTTTTTNESTPPVPPIPKFLSEIPGGYPPSDYGIIKGQEQNQRPISSSKKATKSINGNKKALLEEKNKKATKANGNTHAPEEPEFKMEGTLDPNVRNQLWKLVNGFGASTLSTPTSTSTSTVKGGGGDGDVVNGNGNGNGNGLVLGLGREYGESGNVGGIGGIGRPPY